MDDVRRGIVRGLDALGVDVASFNLGDRVAFYTSVELERDGDRRRALDYEAACTLACNGIKVECWNYLPDIVIVVSSFFLPPELYVNLRERGRHVVLWCTESPYEDERQLKIAPFADTVIVNDPTNLDRFRAVNPRTWYIPHAYDPTVHHADGRTDDVPFSFVGTGYPSRVEFFERAELPDGSLFAGNWRDLAPTSRLRRWVHGPPDECLANDDTARLYRRSVTSANLYRKEAMAPELVDGWAIGPREVELAACGTYFLREPRGEGDDLFPMLPTFTTPAELGEQVRWALAHPDARADAARAARAAIAGRTFRANAAELLRLISA